MPEDDIWVALEMLDKKNIMKEKKLKTKKKK
jgi:hypothetical protein